MRLLYSSFLLFILTLPIVTPIDRETSFLKLHLQLVCDKDEYLLLEAPLITITLSNTGSETIFNIPYLGMISGICSDTDGSLTSCSFLRLYVKDKSDKIIEISKPIFDPAQVELYIPPVAQRFELKPVQKNQFIFTFLRIGVILNISYSKVKVNILYLHHFHQLVDNIC